MNENCYKAVWIRSFLFCFDHGDFRESSIVDGSSLLQFFPSFDSFLKDILSFAVDFLSHGPYVLVQNFGYAVQRINCREISHPLG
jgi:hypothetical protein